MNRFVAPILVSVLLLSCTAPDSDRRTPSASRPAEVTLTWLSVTNWLLEAGDTRILFDGYVSRVDRSTVEADGSSTLPAPLDTAAVQRVRAAVLPDRALDWVLVGHAHWDHGFDVPAWARLTGARIAGARTVCHQAAAHGVAADRCTAVEGGEVLELGPGIIARAVRWHHSGADTDAGRILRAPLELRDPPTLDPATGGLRPGFLEDYPNGGGARAWLITVETAAGPFTLLWSNTGNPLAWDTPIAADSVLFRERGIDIRHLEWATSHIPTRDHLAEALADAGLEAVDLWIGATDSAHVRQVASLLHPRFYAPHHWDDFWLPLEESPGRVFPRETVEAVTDDAGIEVIVVERLFDRIVFSGERVRREDGDNVRETMGMGNRH